MFGLHWLRSSICRSEGEQELEEMLEEHCFFAGGRMHSSCGAAMCERSSLSPIPSRIPSLGTLRTQLGDRIWQQPTNSVEPWEAWAGMMTGAGQTSPGMVFHLCHRFLPNAEQTIWPPSFIFHTSVQKVPGQEALPTAHLQSIQYSTGVSEIFLFLWQMQ